MNDTFYAQLWENVNENSEMVQNNCGERTKANQNGLSFIVIENTVNISIWELSNRNIK
jgi:hypothetical protein